MGIKEDIDLCHYKTQKKVAVEGEKIGSKGEYKARCINPDHEDIHPSMLVNPSKGVYNCPVCIEAKGVTWERHLEERGNSKVYKRNSNKKYLQEKKDNELKNEILLAIDTDINNWKGYFPEMKEEVRTRIPYDLCFLTESERTIAMGALTKAEIFRISELRGRIKKIKNMLEKQKESVKKKESQIKVKFNPRPYSNEILEKYSLKYDDKHRFWIWSKFTGLWNEDAEAILNSILRQKILGKQDYKRYCVAEIVEDLKGLCRVDALPLEPPPHLLPFNNCLYNLDTDKTEEYSPNLFFINKFKVNFIREREVYIGTNQVKGDVVTEILKQIIPEEDLITLLELAAYCMWRGYPYPKMFTLYGNGRNGKSAYYSLLIRIFGMKNISVVTSFGLQHNRFAPGQLYGKLLNVTSEMEYEDLKKTSLLKQLTGGDPLPCERKFKREFLFNNYAKQIFITNSIPETSDKTDAFYSRPFLLEFPRRFEEGINAEPDIFNKLAEDEIEGFARGLIPVLNDLRARSPSEFVFTNHRDIEKTRDEYEELSTPLAQYIKNNTVKDVNGTIYKADLFQKYMQFINDKGGRRYSDRMLSEKMKGLGYTGSTRNKRKRAAWEGIKWKDEEPGLFD